MLIRSTRTTDERSSGTDFHSLCPSCGDTRKITYKGMDGKEYEVACPLCNGRVSKGYGNYLRIRNWVVREYIINGLHARGPENISAYKNGTACMQSVDLKAFSNSAA